MGRDTSGEPAASETFSGSHVSSTCFTPDGPSNGKAHSSSATGPGTNLVPRAMLPSWATQEM
jgi:hypothetical protein